MLEFITNGLLKLIEKELVNHSPEIEKVILEQLSNVADALIGYVTQKIEQKEAAPASQPATEPVQG